MLPDIDIDVESARRLEVYRAIIDRFGTERVATVAMPETYRVRHAIRDVGAALSMDPAEIDRIAKSFPHIRARDARAALEELPELRALAGEMEQSTAGSGSWSRRWTRCRAASPCTRAACSSPTPRCCAAPRWCPPAARAFPCPSSTRRTWRTSGLLKLDVLGVRMQSAMAHAVAEIGRATGEQLDLDDPAQVPAGDPATYQLIRSTETLGCFQIESPGQRDLVGRLQPATFHDLVVDISLFRPGPVAADMVRPFIEARHGRAPVRFPHPDLADALRDTYGVVVFHEQIIEIVDIMTGCGRGEADRVRRGLSDPESQARIKVWFAQRAAERGYAPEVDRAHLGDRRGVRLVRLLQGARRRLRRADLPVGLAQGAPPGRLLRRAAHPRPRDVPEAAAARGRAAARGAGPAGGREPVVGRTPNRTGVRNCWGVRLALSDVHGISEAESGTDRGRPALRLAARLLAAGPARPPGRRTARPGRRAGRVRRQPARPAAPPVRTRTGAGAQCARAAAANSRWTAAPDGRPAGCPTWTTRNGSAPNWASSAWTPPAT